MAAMSGDPRITGKVPTEFVMRSWPGILALLVACLLAACSSQFEPPVMQGAPLMTEEVGPPRLWVLEKVEEQRQVGVGSFSRHSTGHWRTDTYFHFEVQAFDPATARPLWKRRILTIGDAKANDTVSRVVGSGASARILGQDGEVVWVLIDDRPYALALDDGRRLAGIEQIEVANPVLKGLLPVDGRQYGFDHGLVLQAADARWFVIRGRQWQASAYVPPTSPTPPILRKRNGMPVIVPMRPAIGEVPARLLERGDRWLGLYSPREADDARDDSRGRNLRYPYTIANEGKQARRQFWEVDTESFQDPDSDEPARRIRDLRPIAGGASLLNGRFLVPAGSDEPYHLQEPSGFLVWHSTRIDSAGRLALSRFSEDLNKLWTTELPLSENSILTPARFWIFPGQRLVVYGTLAQEIDGTHTRTPHLASIDLRDGRMAAWDLTAGKALP